MNSALWRRRAIFFVNGWAGFFTYLLFTQLYEHSERRQDARLFIIMGICSCLMGLSSATAGEKPEEREILKCADYIITRAADTLASNIRHADEVTALFKTLPRDPALEFIPESSIRRTFSNLVFLGWVWSILLFQLDAWVFFMVPGTLLVFFLVLLPLVIAQHYITANGSGLTIRALLRKSTFIEWSEIAMIEFWKRADGNDDNVKAIVFRDANGTAQLHLQPRWLQKSAAQKFLNYLRTSAPIASTRA